MTELRVFENRLVCLSIEVVVLLLENLYIINFFLSLIILLYMEIPKFTNLIPYSWTSDYFLFFHWDKNVT